MRGPLFVCRAGASAAGRTSRGLPPPESVLRGSQFAETRHAPSAAVHGTIETRSSEDSIASITAAHRYSPNRVSDRSERADRNAENSKDEVADGRKRVAQRTTETEAGGYPACGHKKPDHIIWSGSLYRMLQARGLRDVACGGSNSEPPRGEATARAAPRSRKECCGECSKPEAARCSCIFAHKKPDHVVSRSGSTLLKV